MKITSLVGASVNFYTCMSCVLTVSLFFWTGPFFNAVNLSKLATELDEAEKTTLTEGGMDPASLDKIITQPSSNMDDSGFFSVQVHVFVCACTNVTTVGWTIFHMVVFIQSVYIM